MAELTGKLYILWKNYGMEGYSPAEFDEVKDALACANFSEGDVITKRLQIMVMDMPAPLNTRGGLGK